MRNGRTEVNFTAAKPHESTINRKLTVGRDQFWPKNKATRTTIADDWHWTLPPRATSFVCINFYTN